MKLPFFGVILLLLSFFCDGNVFASDPGSDYGCWIYSTNTVYTNWWKTEHAPGNPDWGPWHYYNPTSTTYAVTYSPDYPSCGMINTNFQFARPSGGDPCFVFVNSGYEQGAFGKIHDLNCAKPINNTPFDDDVTSLIVMLGGVIIYFRNSPFHRMFQNI